MDRLTANDFDQSDGTTDWRCLGTGASAWFTASSLSLGAELIDRIVVLVGAESLPDIDLRPVGLRVRIGATDGTALTWADDELARSISVAGPDLDLTADPAALQAVGLVIDTTAPQALAPFWQTLLAYESTSDGNLQDPGRRGPRGHVSRPGRAETTAQPTPRRRRPGTGSGRRRQGGGRPRAVRSLRGDAGRRRRQRDRPRARGSPVRGPGHRRLASDLRRDGVLPGDLLRASQPVRLGGRWSG